jgi:hypothetical protein
MVLTVLDARPKAVLRACRYCRERRRRKGSAISPVALEAIKRIVIAAHAEDRDQFILITLLRDEAGAIAFGLNRRREVAQHGAPIVEPYFAPVVSCRAPGPFICR